MSRQKSRAPELSARVFLDIPTKQCYFHKSLL